MTNRRSIVLSAVLVLIAALSAGSALPSKAPQQPTWVLQGRYAPSLDAHDFVRTVDNRYFPLKPGTTLHYQGIRDGIPQTDDTVVTGDVKIVLGVRCTVVRDTVSVHGKPIERTLDWYAQDKRGNVWYMGEDSFELKDGAFVRASDSWQAGRRGAKPGIIMPVKPTQGMVYRQEYYLPGGALDQARVLRTNALVRDPSGASRRALVTIEWSPVEPQLETKYYIAGLGELKEQVVAGGHERFQLVAVTP